jgi:sialidase-1
MLFPLICTALALCAADGPAAPYNLYVSGEGGYDTYRIPALYTTKAGTLLAFAEGRKASRGDAGEIDMLLRRSTDGGATWSPVECIWSDNGNTCGNPCVVQDLDTGVIWMLTNWNLGEDAEPKIIAQTSKDSRRVFVSHSEDDGKTWVPFKDITPAVKKSNWTWYAAGPGVGIQLREGPKKGRLVIPCDHMEAVTTRYFSHVIISDDHGGTWRCAGITPQEKVNECQVVELPGGRLMLNMRNYEKSSKTRAISFSDDGGDTWSDLTYDAALIEPICQASLIRCYQQPKPWLLFSNPADSKKRIRMTVKLSEDNGATWPRSLVLFEGQSAYSCITEMGPNQFAILYEAGEKDPYDRIVFQRFANEDLKPAQ